MKEELITKAYEIAKERYAEIGVDTETVIAQMQDFDRWRKRMREPYGLA